MNRRFILLFVFLFIVGVANASAAGILVAPSAISEKVEIGKTSSVRIKVSNPSNDVELIEAYTDTIRSVVNVSPASLMLQAGDERYLTLQISPQESGILDTTLSVVARPLTENAVSVGSGVKIPLHIETVDASKATKLLALMASLFTNSHNIILLGILFAGILGGYFLRGLRKK